MRNLKLSFALIVAIAAIGLTAVTKASNMGARAITDCFVNLTLIDEAGGTQSSLSDGLDDQIAVDRAADFPYVVSVSTIKNKALCPAQALFCCAEIEVTSDTDAPIVTIEGVTNRFKVKQLYFRN